MTDFGDDDPEDAWTPTDPVAELVRNLIRRRERDRTATPSATLERIRRDMFDEDLRTVLARILEGT